MPVKPAASDADGGFFKDGAKAFFALLSGFNGFSLFCDIHSNAKDCGFS